MINVPRHVLKFRVLVVLFVYNDRGIRKNSVHAHREIMNIKEVRDGATFT